MRRRELQVFVHSITSSGGKMQKVSRSIFAGLLVIAGLTACGDKVTVSAPNQGSSSTATPVVHSVTVSPSSVSLKIGETVQLVATVDADAGLARTVTWKSGDSNKATVSSSGLVSAVASGTVVITATSTADATVAGAATIIVAPVTAATISIASIDQGGVPANLNAVAGQLDVTLNVDQGTQTITELDLIVHSNATNKDTTVAKYTFTSSNKAAGSKSSAPITMSFNTAAFNATSGAVSFVNGSYTIKAQAVVAGSSGQAPVSSTINYTVNNADFMNVTAMGDTSASGRNALPVGTLWQGGKVNISLVPVLYSGATLTSATVSADPAFTNTAAQTVTTFPTTVSFAVGKDTLTKPSYQAAATAIYSNGTPFPAVFVPALNVDNEAPAAPTLLQVSNAKGVVGQWIGAGYSFGNSTDYKAANGDSAFTGAVPGVGLGGAKFYAFPKASFTALGAPAAGSKCVTTGGTLVATSADLAQSAPADSTTYNLRALQYDKLGNVRCMDLALNFGVDVNPPVNAKYSNAGAGTNAGGVNPLLAGTNVGYNNTDFVGFQPTAVDSISGFNLATDVTQKVSVNDVTTPATTCSIGTTANGCTVTSGAGVLFPVTGTGGLNDEGYYTIAASIADRAGNSVALPGTMIAIDRTAPVSSGGVAIPAALVGGASVSLQSTITDNMTLMSGGGSVQYTSGLIINYDASSSFASAGTFGTLNKTGTATLGVPWLISDLQPGNGATDPIAQFNVRGTDEVGLSGANPVVIPVSNITTGAGTGAGTNGEWTAADFTSFTVTNAAKTISVGTGTNARSVVLTANVALPANVGLPFSQVCFYYQDPYAVTTAPAPTFQAEYKPTGLCVLSPATSDNTNWVYTSGAWTPPASLYNGAPVAVNLIAIGFGQNGHASYTAVNANITVDN
ncbi:MAG: Ig-like domain-containing protein [Gemmatimonadota bacterium]|nr:Ig-like domain-containing protein [Gemmatimonadota bacterium]